MKHKKHLQESLNTLFARLMSSDEGRWTVVTRTKGKNKQGQRWLTDELVKMAELLKQPVSYQYDPEFRVKKGIDFQHLPFSQRHGIVPSKSVRIQQLPRQAGKSRLTQQLINEMAKENLFRMILAQPKP
ncbi:hypothetical protein [Xanthomonas virus PB119]|nr:hypothetical protein [Xanthomonas virus PB119]